MHVGMDLRVAGIRKQRAALVRAPACRHIRSLRIGRQVIDIPVAARRQHHRVRNVGRDLARHQVARHDAARLAVDHDQVQHLGARQHLHRARMHLPLQRLVGAQQQLLPCLSARVEGARHLRSAKRPVGQRATVLARKRNTLRHALVDDLHADLGQPVDIRLTRTEIAALYRVVKQAVDAVAVVLVILRGVDAALRRNRVCAPRRILEAEALHVVAQLTQRR